jgi:hypothetical protein
MTQLSAKLGRLLRKAAATALVIAGKFTGLVRTDKAAGEPPISTGVTDAPETPNRFANSKAVSEQPDELKACLNSPVNSEPLPAQPTGPPEREKLIRRRWTETGIKMWSPDIHGSGKATLKIQGQAELLPVTPGQTSRAYDKLEFKLIDGCIVCEGVIIDLPKGRARVEHRTNS